LQPGRGTQATAVSLNGGLRSCGHFDCKVTAVDRSTL
jgi:hypothetical protein